MEWHFLLGFKIMWWLLIGVVTIFSCVATYVGVVDMFDAFMPDKKR